MTIVTHEIELFSETEFHGELPPRHLGQILARIHPAAQAAVAMAFRNRSSTPGQLPGWLRRASDVRFLGFSGNGSTRLQFAAPKLEDAARKLYEQRELFETRPTGQDSALDLLTDTLTDVAAGNENSDRFDRPLLHKITGFRKALSGPFSRLSVLGDRRPPGQISPEVIQTARRLSASTPPARRVRIVGKLDSLSDSRQTFELLMDTGARVRGVLLEGSMGTLANLFRGLVLIFGHAHFRPSGELLRVDADEFRLAGEADQFFAKVPTPIAQRKAKPGTTEREKMAKGLKSIMGQWPGEETDEQVELALRGIG